MADQENHQEHNNSYQNPHAQQNLDNSHNNNNYMMHQQNPGMYPPQDYEQAGMLPPQEMMMMNNDSMESANNYDPMDNFPIEALAPFNQGLAAFAGEVDDHKGQRLKEARLMEALERQTSLLDSIAQSYQKNRELRHKADLRKLKNRLEKLENDKLFRELEIQQMQSANDIAQQNNQLIFSHLNAQAQLKANPIVLNMGTSPSSIPPFALHPSLTSLPPLGFPGAFPGTIGMPPRPFLPGPGPQWGPMGPPMRTPPGFAPGPMNPMVAMGPRSGHMPVGMSPIGFNKGVPLRLPPIKDSKRSKGSDSDSDDSVVIKSKDKKGKKGKKDVDNYLSQVFDKYKKR